MKGLGIRFRVLTAAASVALIGLVLMGAYVVVRGYPAELRDRFGERASAAQVVDLHDIDQLKTAFNQDVGTPRLLVLFSPT